MSTIRPLATVAILASLGIFLAMKINQGPIATTAELTGELSEAPAFSAEGGTAAMPAPAFDAAPGYGDAATTAGEPAPMSSPSDAGSYDANGYGAAGYDAGQYGDSPYGQEPYGTPAPATDAAPAIPDLPPLPTLPAADPVTAAAPASTTGGPTMGGPTMGGPEAVDPATLENMPELPLPADIPTASYPDATPGSATAEPPIVGRVPSLGTTTPAYPATRGAAANAPASDYAGTGYTGAGYSDAGYPATETPASTPWSPPAATPQPDPAGAAAAYPSTDSATPSPSPAPPASPYGQPASPADRYGATALDPPPSDFGSPGFNPPATPAPGAATAADPPGVDSAAAYATARPAIQAALDRDELPRAHLLLSQWYGDASLTAQERAEVSRLLSQLAGTVIYSAEHRLEPPHQVQPGETLESIGAKYNTPGRLIGKINGVASGVGVQPGQILKVVRGPFNAVVDASNSELYLTVGDRYAGRFPVRLDGSAAGMQGTWKVSAKSAGGLSLTDAGGSGQPGPAIAGAGVGTTPAQGMISVAARDMGDLIDILSEGSEVTIRK
ncbi:MAG: LysM peptidoglycan-binding domain-containing protein [Planctomycetota bacterium]